MDLHLSRSLLTGKKILKVKRDFNDPFLWVLAQNNEVYRVNSLTFDIDDYTGAFSAFKNLNFIDIAGRSQDTVFIATNSTNIIDYKKGITKLIGAADGIAGIVNSIGLNNIGESGVTFSTHYILAVGTDHGISRYDFKAGTVLPAFINIDSKVFESTYRTLTMTSTSGCHCYPDTVEHKGISNFVNYSEIVGEIYLGGNSFGHNLRSVFSTSGNPYFPAGQFSYYAMQIWATENGLFENYLNYSSSTAFYPTRHYLKGVDISKVTSIYGLLPFGGYYISGLVHENLLVGSLQGLYFSNSEYRKGLTEYSFFHFNELGNKPINDICVNVNSYDITGSNIINRSNSPYGTSNQTSTGYVCENGIWVAANDGLYYITADYLPYVDNTQILSSALTFDGSNFPLTEIQTCAGTPIKMNINTAYYGSSFIAWYKDGVAIPNEIQNSLTATQPGEYYAILYDPCTPVHFETNRLKIKITAAPVFTFNYPDKITYCDGATATLKTESNIAYLYRWYKDGVLNGNTTATLNTTQAGKYKLEVSACAANWVATKEVQIDFIKITQPVITANKQAYCLGDDATLSVNVPNGTYVITWFRDGIIMIANQNKNSITTNLAGSYTVNVSDNLATCNQTSLAYPLSFEIPPTISIKKLTTATLCDGQTVDLKATYSGGVITWSTGAATDKINVNQTAIYTATVKTVAGCEISKDINIQFLPNPVINVPDATLCQFTNQTLTLTAPAGFTKYQWNGQTGTSNFSTSQLGKVTLTVTDNNGCTATQTINITSHCDDIHLPNAFTPNGDGINDTWIIEGLQGDLTTTVKVYNRYGENVFQSTGYAIPWSGNFNGKKLPAGVYYYVISAHASNKVINGTVTIIY